MPTSPIVQVHSHPCSASRTSHFKWLPTLRAPHGLHKSPCLISSPRLSSNAQRPHFGLADGCVCCEISRNNCNTERGEIASKNCFGRDLVSFVLRGTTLSSWVNADHFTNPYTQLLATDSLILSLPTFLLLRSDRGKCLTPRKTQQWPPRIAIKKTSGF